MLTHAFGRSQVLVQIKDAVSRKRRGLGRLRLLVFGSRPTMSMKYSFNICSTGN
jgi:hypothetical protein